MIETKGKKGKLRAKKCGVIAFSCKVRESVEKVRVRKWRTRTFFELKRSISVDGLGTLVIRGGNWDPYKVGGVWK